MDPEHKSILKGLSLTIRHLLEGYYDGEDQWHPGNLERRLNEIGIWRDRDPKAIDELPHLSDVDLNSRRVVDAYLQYREEAGVPREEAVEEFVRESAYTWANRLFALRCMEARGLIDEVVLQKDVYGWRSLQHNRLALKHPELCAGDDDGLFTVLFQEFERRAKELPQLFNPNAPTVALRPLVAALKKCIALLSGREAVNGKEFASDAVFEAPDAFGMAYQYWNEEEKNRVFERVRTAKVKIEGADMIPVTCIYTEPYMVKFLLQNSLGATWMGMHPDSKLVKKWEYYVKDADRAPVDKKNVFEITFLDPACGSGHFLLEAFDIFYDMYREEGTFSTSEEICASILNNNLFGIDIDERAVQISIAVLWMKAKEKAPRLKAKDLSDFHDHLIATNIRLPKDKDHLEDFIKKYPEDLPLRAALEMVFEGLTNAFEIGSLLQIEEPVEKEMLYIKNKLGPQRILFGPKTDQEWENWRQTVITQLKEHFNTEAVSSDLIQSYFSQSAGKGLSLFDILARRYDVVATNPPYMGSGNIGPVLKEYINRHYGPGKHDLYATFILRCLELAQEKGRIAMVTQQSWMFLRSFDDLRAINNNKCKQGTQKFQGLLRESSFETIVQLGTKAFEEISGEVVNVVLFTLSKMIPTDNHYLTAFRLVGLKDPKEKDIILKKTNETFKKNQKVFLNLDRSPLLYWLTDELLTILYKYNKLSNYGVVGEGLSTSNNARFVRMFWETPFYMNNRWIELTKGGGYKKWAGLSYYEVDWEFEGSRVKNFIIERYPYLKGNYSFKIKNEDVYRQVALTYSTMAQGSMSARQVFDANYDNSGSFIVPYDSSNIYWIACILNSRICSFLLRAITQSLAFKYKYLQDFPIPLIEDKKNISILGEIIHYLVLIRDKRDILERGFNPSYHTDLKNGDLSYKALNALILSLEGFQEKIILEIYHINKESKKLILNETGIPVGWYPLISGYDDLPQLPEQVRMMPIEVLQYHDQHARMVLSTDEHSKLKNLIYRRYLAGPGADFEENNQTKLEDEEEKIISGYIPIPSETFIEELSHKLKIHPISVYWLLNEGIEKEGWRCLPEEQSMIEDRCTLILLQLLGYRWPKQIERGEPVHEWADPDGIIPITEGTGEPTLLDRVRKRISENSKYKDLSKFEQKFSKIMGRSLDEWLSTEFFKHHTKHFKKRPIAWQLESTSIASSKRKRGRRKTARDFTGPAFSCIVYYHKIDADFLPKIRSQYVRPLCNRYETELRTLENLQTPTIDQTERRITLEKLIDELKELDTKLEKVINNGFGCPLLEKIITREPLDKWTSEDGKSPPPANQDQFYIQEKAYNPDLNDGVRVNIAPLQKAGLLAADVLSKKDVDKAIRDRAEWRADERRWCREGKLPQPGWWKEKGES